MKLDAIQAHYRTSYDPCVKTAAVVLTYNGEEVISLPAEYVDGYTRDEHKDEIVAEALTKFLTAVAEVAGIEVNGR